MPIISIGYILFIDVVTAIIGVGIFTIGVKYIHIKNEGKLKEKYFTSIIAGLKYVMNHKFIKRFLTYYVIISVLVAPIRSTYSIDGNTYIRSRRMEAYIK